MNVDLSILNGDLTLRSLAVAAVRMDDAVRRAEGVRRELQSKSSDVFYVLRKVIEAIIPEEERGMKRTFLVSGSGGVDIVVTYFGDSGTVDVGIVEVPSAEQVELAAAVDVTDKPRGLGLSSQRGEA